jgi:hypothetical protein
MWQDKQFFKYLMQDFIKEGYDCILSTSCKPLDGYIKVVQKANELLPEENMLGDFSDKVTSEYAWVIGEKDLNEDVFDLINSFWYYFEQTSLLITNDLKAYAELDIKNMYWHDIVQKSNSFLFYKGLQEEVIWIGKSGNINFPSINLEDKFI